MTTSDTHRAIEAVWRIESARLIAGNSGGLDVQINGRPVGSLGPRGQPRTYILTPAGAEVVLPPARPADPQTAQPAPPPQNPPVL